MKSSFPSMVVPPRGALNRPDPPACRSCVMLLSLRILCNGGFLLPISSNPAQTPPRTPLSHPRTRLFRRSALPSCGESQDTSSPSSIHALFWLLPIVGILCRYDSSHGLLPFFVWSSGQSDVSAPSPAFSRGSGRVLPFLPLPRTACHHRFLSNQLQLEAGCVFFPSSGSRCFLPLETPFAHPKRAGVLVKSPPGRTPLEARYPPELGPLTSLGPSQLRTFSSRNFPFQCAPPHNIL